MSTGRAAQELNLVNKLSLRALLAVHLQLSFVAPYQTAGYLFVVDLQGGIIGKTT